MSRIGYLSAFGITLMVFGAFTFAIRWWSMYYYATQEGVYPFRNNLFIYMLVVHSMVMVYMIVYLVLDLLKVQVQTTLKFLRSTYLIEYFLGLLVLIAGIVGTLGKSLGYTWHGEGNYCEGKYSDICVCHRMAVVFSFFLFVGLMLKGVGHEQWYKYTKKRAERLALVRPVERAPESSVVSVEESKHDVRVV